MIKLHLPFPPSVNDRAGGMISAQLLDLCLVDCSDERIASLLPWIGAHHGVGADIESLCVSDTGFDRPTFAEQTSCVSWRPYDFDPIGQLDGYAISPDVGHGSFSAFDKALTAYARVGSCSAVPKSKGPIAI